MIQIREKSNCFLDDPETHSEGRMTQQTPPAESSFSNRASQGTFTDCHLQLTIRSMHAGENFSNISVKVVFWSDNSWK